MEYGRQAIIKRSRISYLPNKYDKSDVNSQTFKNTKHVWHTVHEAIHWDNIHVHVDARKL